MIVCQCNVLSGDALAEAIADMRARPEPTVITPGLVFKCCGAKFQCSGCMALVTQVIAQSFEMHQPDLTHCTLRLPTSYSSSTALEDPRHERRQESHRGPEQGTAS
jgi:bacterioferritin-associated ferredoxin